MGPLLCLLLGTALAVQVSRGTQGAREPWGGGDRSRGGVRGAVGMGGSPKGKRNRGGGVLRDGGSLGGWKEPGMGGGEERRGF